MTSRPRVVTILHIEDCPNLVFARARVEAAVERAGIDAVIDQVLVTADGDTPQPGFRGSPTILVDGQDPFEGDRDNIGCRLYPVGDHVEGAPSVEQLQAALTRSL